MINYWYNRIYNTCTILFLSLFNFLFSLFWKVKAKACLNSSLFSRLVRPKCLTITRGSLNWGSKRKNLRSVNSHYKVVCCFQTAKKSKLTLSMHSLMQPHERPREMRLSQGLSNIAQLRLQLRNWIMDMMNHVLIGT